ncbi:putative FAD synthase [Dioscorea sansibarensis]
MERGGGVVLHSNLRIQSSIPRRWTPFSRSCHPLPPSGYGACRKIFRTIPRASSLVDHLRLSNFLNDKRHMLVNKAIHKSRNALSIYSSCGSREASASGGEMRENELLVDCGTDQEECVVGGIVALGKFDALHIGHRELAIQASKAGTPFLLSFVRMAEVLGWEYRPPIVAKCDRKHVLSSWAPYCGNVIPLEYEVDFSKVRHLTPRQFVERLSKELRVSGVVAGENYRFGYRASGDASELVRLCKGYGLEAYIVRSVMDKSQPSYNGTSKGINSNDRGQVSSTRVRRALALCDMVYVGKLLGRKHRLVLSVDRGSICRYGSTLDRFSIPKLCMLNQPPGDGVFDNCSLLVDDAYVGPCRVIIDTELINIESDDGSSCLQEHLQNGQLLGIEFGW